MIDLEFTPMHETRLLTYGPSELCSSQTLYNTPRGLLYQAQQLAGRYALFGRVVVVKSNKRWRARVWYRQERQATPRPREEAGQPSHPLLSLAL